jgi:phosphatidylglycerophosphate synthase
LLTATIAGIDIPGLALGALAVGALTDALDGPLARRLRQSTKLGSYVDGEADLVLAMALTLAAVRSGALPAYAGWLVAARYALPVGAAFGVAFATARPPALEHTLPGRLRGVAQTALIGYVLVPKRGQPLDMPGRLLLGLTAAFSLASAAAQLRRVLCPERSRAWPLQPVVIPASQAADGNAVLISLTRDHPRRWPRREHA